MSLLKKSSAPLAILIIVAVLGIAQSAYIVKQTEQAIVLQLGKPKSGPMGPGLHFKPPWPFGKVVLPEFIRTETVGEGRDAKQHEVVDETSTGVRILQLGAEPPADAKIMLWANEDLQETLMIVQPSQETAASRTRDFGRGLAMASVRVPVYYSIKPGGVEAYLRLGIDAKTRDQMLRLAAQRELMRELASRSVDEVVGSGRNEIRESLKNRISAAFDALNPDASGKPMGAGVDVLFVGFEDARPPKEAAKAYEQVLEASQKSATVIIQAQQSRAETLAKVVGSIAGAEEIVKAIAELDAMTRTADPQTLLERELAIREMIEDAGGEAGDMILAARADRWKEHMSARALAEEYRGKLAAFQAAPQIYENRMRFEAIKDAIKDLRIYIVDESVQKRIRLDLMDKYIGSSGFDPVNDGDM